MSSADEIVASLTDGEAAAYRLRQGGMSYSQIAKAMKLQRSTVQSLVSKAIGKGMEKLDRRIDAKSVDVFLPEASSDAMIEGYSEAGFNRDRFLEAAKQAGIPPRMAVALCGRIQNRYNRLVGPAIRRLRAEEISEMLAQKITMAGDWLDDAVLADASAKDLAYVLDRLIEKHQLLNDRPTQVFDVHQSMKLGELLAAAQKEAARRGITIEQKPVVVSEEEPVP